MNSQPYIYISCCFITQQRKNLLTPKSKHKYPVTTELKVKLQKGRIIHDKAQITVNTTEQKVTSGRYQNKLTYALKIKITKIKQQQKEKQLQHNIMCSKLYFYMTNIQEMHF